MKLITLRVHPLTRRVLLSEYGAEPLRIGQRDILYSALTTGQTFDRNDLTHADRLLTGTVSLEVSDSLAEHLRLKWRMVGLHLFRWHKDWMFRFAATRVRSGTSAKGAIREWLDLYDVGEDDYSADTAYKKWQRSGWFLQKKNSDFSGKLLKTRGSKISGKSGIYAKSKRPSKHLVLTIREVDIEIESAKCASFICAQLRRPPKNLLEQIRAYLYKELGGYTDREISEKMQHPLTTINDMRHSLRRRANQNPFIAGVLAEVKAYALNPA